MIILAIDTSHAVGSVALSRDGGLLGAATFSAPATHLVELARAVERLLSENGLTARDVSRVAVVLGPGSFTGVRIAVAYAKGLSAAGAEVVGMSSLRVLAEPNFGPGVHRVCAMIDARRGEVYAAVFENSKSGIEETTAARAQAPEAFLDGLRFAPDVFVGTGALVHRDVIGTRFPSAKIADEASAFPSMAAFAAMAHTLPVYSRDAVRTLEPIYLRASGAERKRLRAHAPETDRDG